MKTKPLLMFALTAVSTFCLTACGTGSKSAGNVGATNATANSVGNTVSGNGSANTTAVNNALGNNNKTTSVLKGSPIGNISVPKGFSPTAVQMVDLQHAFIADSNNLYETSNGGTSWKAVWHGQVTIKRLDFENATDGFALVVTPNSGGLANGLQLWHTTDGGVHWTTVATEKNFQLGKLSGNSGYRLSFTSRDTGSITVSPGGKTIETKDGGSTWKVMPIPTGTVASTYSGSSGYAVVNETTRYAFEKTTDSGHQWTILKTIPETEPYQGAKVRTYGQHGVWIEVLGGVGMTQQSYSLYRSNDGGSLWETVIASSTAGGGPAPGGTQQALSTTSPGSYPGSLDVESSSLAYFTGSCPACGEHGQVRVAKITSRGVTVLPPKLGGLDSWVLFLDANHGWLVSSLPGTFTDVYQTANGGQSWQLKAQFVATQK